MIVSFPRTHGGKHFIIFDGLPFMKRDTVIGYKRIAIGRNEISSNLRTN